MRITQIRKRDGRIVKFDEEKITSAIFRAILATIGRDYALAQSLSRRVVEVLDEKYGAEAIPAVEDAQDVVERVLVENGQSKVAKAYILYRQKRAEIRAEKQRILEKDVIDEVDKAFDLNALRVLKARYLRKDELGKLIETPKELFTRVAVHVTLPDLLYGKNVHDLDEKQTPRPVEAFNHAAYEERFSIGKYRLNRYHLEALKRVYDRFNSQGRMKVPWPHILEMLEKGEFNSYEENITRFYDLMVSRRFLPNTPAIANFGNVLGMGSACFVLGVDDSIESIMDTLKSTAVVFKAGGGMGYNFSKLRPEGDFVSSTSGIASGPISFMMLFDTMTDVIKQGGIRRGANMGILNSDHPDIEKFITAKKGNKALRNFNISVLIKPEFWDHYNNNKPYSLVNPRTGQTVREIDPHLLFDMIVYQAWESAEPGVIFYDHVNEFNPFLKHLGPIVTTNPCVSSDTMISTVNGLERIDCMLTRDVMIDARTLATSESSGQISLQLGTMVSRILRVVKTGRKPTYRIITRAGYELTATADHRILTEDGWKTVSELSPGDRVLVQSGKGCFNLNRKLPIQVTNSIVTKKGRRYSWRLPHEWSRELGLCIGWLVGDGWINTKHNQAGWVFAGEDGYARKTIEPIINSYLGRRSTEVRVAAGVTQLRTASKYVVRFLSALGLSEVGKDREVPWSLFTATEEGVIGFLQGLFASDGSVQAADESRFSVRLNSSSLKLLKGVQLLLLNLGIYSAIYDRSTKPKHFHYTTRKGERRDYSTSGVNYELIITSHSMVRFIEKVGLIKPEHLQIARGISKAYTRGPYSEEFKAPIESIEYAGEKEVWDIMEPSTHSFIANGIVVHNCGEVLLYPNESCNLGSINVWAFLHRDDTGEPSYDWDGLSEAVRLATRFLDNVIDVNNFPLKAIEDMTLATRKIGLGVMGLADLLFEMRLSYNSDEARKFMEKLMEFVNYHSKLESIELAKERGSLPYLDRSFYPEGHLPFRGSHDHEAWHFKWDEVGESIKKYGVRNGYTTVVAPTGSISMIAGCSSGIEPVYSLVFEKHVKVGSFYYIDPVFERVMSEEGLFGEDLLRDVNDHGGSIQRISYIPEELKRVFVTAMDIRPEDHIRALAAFQRWVDSSISKTNNFPANATVEDMRESYLLAYKLGCKDVTVFRDTSIKGQVLVTPQRKKEKPREEKKTPSQTAARPPEILTVPLVAGSGRATEQIKLCPQCQSPIIFQEGCDTCPECGWGACS